ncbi:hypothetical protein IHV25_00235 [Phaeovibrio sulfidiphilus]|uniref:Uncharacterized protein n=2 Tax=Phaeovibrio sulfidiphilus TaxID=1220600 RepID=A0A8J6YKI8_9PROT|nr:hypothetical protein [Phaeovibrio sulfidiphilus]
MPGPYAHRDLGRLENPLVALKSGAGVTVRPVEGLPVPWNRLIALEAVELLHGQGIPAETGTASPLGHTLTWTLDGAPMATDTPAAGASAPKGPRVIRLAWTLDGEPGEPVTVPVEAVLWDRAAPEAAIAVARPVVEALARQLGGGPEEPRSRAQASADSEPGAGPAAPPRPDARAEAPPRVPPAARTSPEEQRRERERAAEAATVVALKPRITRAPGDGVQALTRALSAQITAAGVRLTENPAKATFAIVGTVTTEPVAGKKEKVTLVWEVQDPRSGAVLGTATQENFIPAGLLDQPWGPLADTIAAGALEGIGEILAAPPP